MGLKGTGRSRVIEVEGYGRKAAVIVPCPMIDQPITSTPSSSSFLVPVVVLQGGSAGWKTLR